MTWGASLLLATLAPWVTGFVLLRAAEKRLAPAMSANLPRQLGYGFFFGELLLYGLYRALQALAPGSGIAAASLALGACTLAGAALLWQGRKAAHAGPGQPAPQTMSTAARLLTGLLLAWAAAHLALAAVEILSRPTYPWDAWLNWTYRARAWFYQGALTGFASPADWVTGATDWTYNVAGNHYPGLVPFTAFWAATAAGRWSDTLVNLPALWCGIALALAVYGQCRDAGMERLWAAAAVYLLVSLPLPGTHLSLAGMADIWMAGFCGLGFIALLLGLYRREARQILTGLAMLAGGLAVKQEGVVWLLMAMALAVLALRPRAALVTAGLAVVAALALWLGGHTAVTLGGLGMVGYLDGYIHLPGTGPLPFVYYDLWRDYYVNFLARDNWHLLYGLLAITLTALPMACDRRLVLVVTGFALLALASQLVIFGLSPQGEWAKDSTAINRLPIQFAPAIVFCVVLGWQRLVAAGSGETHRSGAILLPALALLLVAGLALALLARTVPADPAGKRVYTPGDLRFAVGDGELGSARGRVTQLENGIAIVSSGPTYLDAGSLTRLKLTLEGDPVQQAGFFWRRKDAAGDVASLPLAPGGTRIVDLSRNRDWRGIVTEFGLVLYDAGASSTRFGDLVLSPPTLSLALEKTLRDWTQFEPWSQQSANFIEGGATRPFIPLPLLLLVWVAACALLGAIVPGRWRLRTGALALCALAGWMLLDLRWVVNRGLQAAHTVAYYAAPHTPGALDVPGDEAVAAFVARAVAQLPAAPVQVEIVTTDANLEFHGLRAKYLLLPHAGYVHDGGIYRLRGRRPDYLLALYPTRREPGSEAPDSDRLAAAISEQLGSSPRTVLDAPIGALFELLPRQPAAGTAE